MRMRVKVTAPMKRKRQEPDSRETGNGGRAAGLAEAAMAGRELTFEEGLFLAGEECDLDELMHFAGRIRERYGGLRVYRCSIINGRSGRCSEDCAFCAQSAIHRTDIEEHALVSVETIVDAARKAAEEGIDCFGIVTSGKSVDRREIETIIEVLHRCRAMGIDNIGASLGILGFAALAEMKAAGLRHYNHNLETAERFYPIICTTHTWRQRRETVIAALRAGLDVCSGGIFGLGETWEDRLSLALSLREIGVQNVPLNFLSPIAGTPLEDRPVMKPEEALRIVSVFRFMLPSAVLRVCGGRPTAFGARGSDIFAAGGSGILTGDYLTTSGYSCRSDREMIVRLGLETG